MYDPARGRHVYSTDTIAYCVHKSMMNLFIMMTELMIPFMIPTIPEAEARLRTLT